MRKPASAGFFYGLMANPCNNYLNKTNIKWFNDSQNPCIISTFG